MKNIADRSKNLYRYNCDKCGKEISFDNKTRYELNIKYSNRNGKKLCDLCSNCYEEINNIIFKGGNKND